MGNDFLHDFGSQRFDIGPVGKLGVGHDGGRVRVDQNDPIALRLERLAGLGAGVIEFARLADNDRPGANQQNSVEVGSFGHDYRV